MRDRFLELEGRWCMGRFAPRELLDGIDRYLRLETPERRKELLATIRTRTKELEEQDKDRFRVLAADDPLAGYTDRLNQHPSGEQTPG